MLAEAASNDKINGVLSCETALFVISMLRLGLYCGSSCPNKKRLLMPWASHKVQSAKCKVQNVMISFLFMAVFLDFVFRPNDFNKKGCYKMQNQIYLFYSCNTTILPLLFPAL